MNQSKLSETVRSLTFRYSPLDKKIDYLIQEEAFSIPRDAAFSSIYA